MELKYVALQLGTVGFLLPKTKDLHVLHLSVKVLFNIKYYFIT